MVKRVTVYLPSLTQSVWRVHSSKASPLLHTAAVYSAQAPCVLRSSSPVVFTFKALYLSSFKSVWTYMYTSEFFVFSLLFVFCFFPSLFSVVLHNRVSFGRQPKLSQVEVGRGGLSVSSANMQAATLDHVFQGRRLVKVSKFRAAPVITPIKQ